MVCGIQFIEICLKYILYGHAMRQYFYFDYKLYYDRTHIKCEFKILRCSHFAFYSTIHIMRYCVVKSVKFQLWCYCVSQFFVPTYRFIQALGTWRTVMMIYLEVAVCLTQGEHMKSRLGSQSSYCKYSCSSLDVMRMVEWDVICQVSSHQD
jgi:hypothetical protein